jgi:hypothetical protein
MLLIRAPQLQALAAVREAGFRLRLAAHVRERFTAESTALGAAGGDEAIQRALDKGASHGFVTERDLCRFVDLAFLFGHDFDTDPALPWASALLSAPRVLASSRMERLWKVGMGNLAQRPSLGSAPDPAPASAVSGGPSHEKAPCGPDDRQKRRLLDLLFYKLEGEGTSLFALMDAAREPRVLKAIAESGLDHECLLSGDLDPAIRAAAPYIVRMAHGSLGCERLILESWGRQWGMFVSARVGLRTVHHHLRTFLRVQTEEHRKLLFRYYDPRVLRVFLPTCDTGQLWQIFGPIQRFDTEAPDSGQLLRFRIDPGSGSSLALRSWTYPLSAQEDADDDQGPSLQAGAR